MTLQLEISRVHKKYRQDSNIGATCIGRSAGEGKDNPVLCEPGWFVTKTWSIDDRRDTQLSGVWFG